MAGDFDADEIRHLRALEAHEEIRHATCAEVADSALQSAGLPLLGQSEPVRGMRLDIDRRGERANPPQFLDGLLKSAKPHRSFKLQAYVPSEKSWRLRLTRDLKPHPRKPATSLVTEFTFTPDARLNRPTCELESLAFNGTGYAEAVDVHDCLALVELNAASARTWVKDPTVLGWVKEDCEFGLHYFRAAKDALLEDAKKRAR